MRGIQFVLFFVIVSALTGCGRTATPTPMPSTQTPIVQSLFTPKPSKAAVVEEKEKRQDAEGYVPPTSTPQPALRTSGPYFAYFRADGDGYCLVMVDADGEGMKTINLPKELVDSYSDEQYNFNMQPVSPDGHWLAFYTGSAGDMWDATAQGPYDLTLNLLDLTTGEIKVVTPLLSADYPNNFVQAAEGLKDPEITAESLQGAFLNGIRNSLAWSPDGEHLAFAGQMDGLSSDLYVYDLKSEKIRRLSSGDQELQWINWSPDGKWILHAAVYMVGAGMRFDIYAAAADGSSYRHLSTASLYTGIEQWLNPHTYFENESDNGPGNYGLRLVDIETGKVTNLWDGSYFAYTPNRAGDLVIVNAMLPDISPYSYSGDDPNFVPGPYLIDLPTMQKTKVGTPADEVPFDYAFFPFDLEGQEFILMGSRSSSYFLSETLELTPLELQGAKIAISPDSNYWAAVTDEAVNIYSSDNVLIHSLPLSLPERAANQVTWSPDFSGLFILSESNIYIVDIPNGQITLIETHLASSYWGPVYLWVNNQ